MLLSSRSSVWVWVIAVGLVLAAAVPAGATVRTAVYTWTPATGPVAGYRLYASIDGNAEMIYSHVNQPSAVIEVESGASVVVSVAAFDVTGGFGPRSDASPPLRLCPGDFDGDQILGIIDLNRLERCIHVSEEDDCAGGDLNDDGWVSNDDYLAFEPGADACRAVQLPGGCPGDVDGDGWISTSDVNVTQKCLGLLPLGKCAYADFDGNGFVAGSDLNLTIRGFGQPACSQ